MIPAETIRFSTNPRILRGEPSADKRSRIRTLVRFGHAEVVETLIRDMLPEDVGRIDFATLPNGPATGWIGFWPSASGHG